ncbi:MAG: hypothetical protein AABZ74_08870 [Cyanobacteriota bacterium]
MINRVPTRIMPAKSISAKKIEVKKEKPLEENIFAELGKVLDFLGVENQYVPIDQKNKMEQLLVKLKNIDTSLDPTVMEIVFLNDMFKIAEGEPDEDEYKDEDEQPSEIIQFFAKLPISTTESNLLGIGNIILRFNPYINLGGFGLTEENEVYYRYCLMRENRQINSLMVMEIIDMAVFFLNILGKEIKCYSEGDKTIEEALTSGLQNLVNITVPPPIEE